MGPERVAGKSQRMMQKLGSIVLSTTLLRQRVEK